MIFGIKNCQKGITIGIDKMPNRKKLCLVVEEGNTETKYATFNNDYSAYEFMKKLMNLVKLEEENK